MRLRDILFEGAKPTMVSLKKWYTYTPEQVMNYVYWVSRQIPPTNKKTWEQEWKNVKKQLEKKYPPRESVNEGTDYTVYHNTYSDAVQAAEKWVESKGYMIDEDDWAREIAFGPKKPSKGKTNRATIGLFKNGREQRKSLHIQVYGMDSGKYELNAYIN